MKKTILSALVFAPLFAGCVATSDTEDVANLDRNAAVADLTTRMDDLGYAYPLEVQPGIDEFLNISAIILERQRNVMGEYRTQTDNYRDVQAFLDAHKQSTPEQLQVAIIEFDAGSTNKDEQIGHKIAAYNSASEGIYQQNVELATELSIEIAKSAIILSQYGPEIAKVTALNFASSGLTSFLSSDEEKKEAEENPKGLVPALLKAKEQLSLALEANKIIEMEQSTIAAFNKLQLELEAKS